MDESLNKNLGASAMIVLGNVIGNAVADIITTMLNIQPATPAPAPATTTTTPVTTTPATQGVSIRGAVKIVASLILPGLVKMFLKKNVPDMVLLGIYLSAFDGAANLLSKDESESPYQFVKSLIPQPLEELTGFLAGGRSRAIPRLSGNNNLGQYSVDYAGNIIDAYGNIIEYATRQPAQLPAPVYSPPPAPAPDYYSAPAPPSDYYPTIFGNNNGNANNKIEEEEDVEPVLYGENQKFSFI